MDESKVIASPNINGLIVINTLRKQLAVKVNDTIRQMCKLTEYTAEQADELADKIIGRLAVMDALDVITDDEYSRACDKVNAFIHGEAIEPMAFDKLEHHYTGSYDFNDAQIILKINVQECLNINFEHCRNAVIPAMYSEADCMKVNRNIASVAREFAIITQNEYDKAMRMIEDYRAGKKTPDEFIIIPKQWYTAL